ncbi:hypothetical protein ACFORG_17830 [Lutimaribacter marinistellae]|uniref:Uncharacterized protein n=1 Tax=Lutimaribacter marinistellae TaxID=1820329 RepID=A0ABV7TK26_9RHOB
MFLGFLGLVAVQIGRAGVDSAEYAQQNLKIAREQLEISRQRMRADGYSDVASFADQADAAADDAGQSFADLRDTTPDEQNARPSRLLTNGTEPEVEGPKPGQSLTYNGQEIAVVESGFVYRGTVFGTLEKAKRSVDLST